MAGAIQTAADLAGAKQKRGGRFYQIQLTPGQTQSVSIAGRCFSVLSCLFPVFIAPDNGAQSIYWDGMGLFSASEFNQLSISVPSSIGFSINAGSSPTFPLWIWIGYDEPLAPSGTSPFWRSLPLASADLAASGLAYFPDVSGGAGNIQFGGQNGLPYLVTVPVFAIRRKKLVVSGPTGANAAGFSTINQFAGPVVAVGPSQTVEIEASGFFVFLGDSAMVGKSTCLDIYEVNPNCPN
jgi:hypothetical protein